VSEKEAIVEDLKRKVKLTKINVLDAVIKEQNALINTLRVELKKVKTKQVGQSEQQRPEFNKYQASVYFQERQIEDLNGQLSASELEIKSMRVSH